MTTGVYEPSQYDNPALGIFFGVLNIEGTDNQPMRIMHAAAHTGRNYVKSCHSINKLSPLSVGRTEMSAGGNEGIKIMHKEMPDYRITAVDKGGHSLENPIGLRAKGDDKTDLVSGNVYKLSDKIPDHLGEYPGIGNDRWMTVEIFHHYGAEYFHAATHWNAGIQSRVNGAILPNARAHAMIGAFHTMLNVLEPLTKRCAGGFITGDFNYRRPHIAELWDYSPQKLFQQLGMKWHEEGIDYIAWTHSIRQSAPIRVIKPGGINPDDHPWLIGHFVQKKQSKK